MSFYFGCQLFLFVFFLCEMSTCDEHLFFAPQAESQPALENLFKYLLLQSGKDSAEERKRTPEEETDAGSAEDVDIEDQLKRLFRQVCDERRALHEQVSLAVSPMWCLVDSS